MNRVLTYGVLVIATILVTCPALAQSPGAESAAAGSKKSAQKKTQKRKKKGDMAGQRTLVDALDDQVPLEVGVQLRIFRQARKRKNEIERLEGELDRRSTRLKALIGDVELRYKTLRLVQDELAASAKEASEEAEESPDQTDTQIDQVRAEKVAKLAKVFDKMKAEDAAKMIPAMELPLVVSVIERIKPKQSAKILSKIDPQKAAEITGMMTSTRRGKKGRRTR